MRGDVLHQQILQARGTAIPSVGQLVSYLYYRRKDIARFIRQQRRSGNVIHVRDVWVEFYKVGGVVFARERDEAVFDDCARVGLHGDSQYAEQSKGEK